jgi:hypothetical protein
MELRRPYLGYLRGMGHDRVTCSVEDRDDVLACLDEDSGRVVFD